MRKLPFPPLRALARAAVAAACAAFLPAQAQAVRAVTIAEGLEHPWAVAVLAPDRFLVTERPGRMRIVGGDGKLGAPLQGVPEVAARGQGGLLDVVLDSGFASNRTLYFCYAEPALVGSGTALARARLSADSTRLENLQVLFSQQPKVTGSSNHFGCRIVETRGGTLFMTLGDRFSRKDDAQKSANHIGKVIHITKEGKPAPGNPYAQDGGLPEIFSIGHRNSQGATLGPDGALWMHEHGPQGGDEINVPQAGRNYGWPVITYGENYGGGKIGEGITSRAGLEQPLHYWVPSIAPSGMAFLTSDRYGPQMKGNLFLGSLKFGYLARLEISDGKVVREHRLLEGIGRVRDVRQGPDGYLYLVTDAGNGKLVRVMPQ